jgi:hypothetical protein
VPFSLAQGSGEPPVEIDDEEPVPIDDEAPATDDDAPVTDDKTSDVETVSGRTLEVAPSTAAPAGSLPETGALGDAATRLAVASAALLALAFAAFAAARPVLTGRRNLSVPATERSRP